MSTQNLNPLKLALHRKINSQLPSLSLSELQKNYFALKGKNKNNDRFSLSNLHIQESNNDILIKSPFYDRSNCTNKKATCKCQFHKRQKLFIQKVFPFQKKPKQIQQLNLDRMKTLENQSPLADNKIDKYYSVKRFSSTVTESYEKIQNQKFQRLKKLAEQNQEQYIEYLKTINEQRSSEVDCHNLEFEQFLKARVIREGKQKKTYTKLSSISKKNSIQDKSVKMVSVPSTQQKPLSAKNQRHLLRFKTVPTKCDDEDEDETSNGNKSKSKKQIPKYSNLEQSKINKPTRKVNKKLTEFGASSTDSFSFNSSGNKNSKYHFFNWIDSLKPEERSKLQQFYQQSFAQIGLNYSEIRTKSIDNPQFFYTLCKNLNSSESTIVQHAKKVLNKISKLPLHLYSSVLKQIKNQIEIQSQNLFSTKTKNKSDEIQKKQKVMSFAFDTIQNSIEQLIKSKSQFKGKQKIAILGKLKNRFIRKASLNFMKNSEIKSKYKSPSSFTESKRSSTLTQIKDPKKSRFAAQIQTQNPPQEIPQSQNMNLTENNNNQVKKTLQKPLPQVQEELVVKQKHKQLKKGKKLKKDKNIIKMIDQEIEEQINSRAVLPKTPNQKIEDEYDKQRAKSRKKLRDEEYRQHLQFMKKMNERSNERQLSTISIEEPNKNTVQGHFLKNKKFIRSMEHYLIGNSDLKDIIINQRQNLFTKKRKIRILNDMIDQLLVAEPQSAFYRDMKKYVEIFKKSCNLAVKEKINKKYKKLAKKKHLDEELYEEDFRTKQAKNSPFNMEDFITSINFDNQLRFYKVGVIKIEQEDVDSIIKQFVIRPIQQKKPSQNKEQYVKQQTEQQAPVQKKVFDEDLIQVNMDNNSQKVSMQKFYEIQPSSTSRFSYEVEEQSQQIKRLKKRFRKNMEKYQKVFNTDPSFTST